MSPSMTFANQNHFFYHGGVFGSNIMPWLLGRQFRERQRLGPHVGGYVEDDDGLVRVALLALHERTFGRPWMLAGISVVSYAGQLDIARSFVLFTVPAMTLTALGLAVVFSRRERSSAARLLTIRSAPARTISTGMGT